MKIVRKVFSAPKYDPRIKYPKLWDIDEFPLTWEDCIKTGKPDRFRTLRGRGKFNAVYYLYDKNQCLVYIGETRLLLERLREHLRAGKPFKFFKFREYRHYNNAMKREREDIKKYRPRYNKAVL